jgi:predicted nucleic acid-binding protein
VKEVFADTYYFLALLVPNDSAHPSALAASQNLTSRIVTTSWVLTEVADSLADPVNRVVCADFIEALCRRPLCVVVPPTQQLFDEGLALYKSRPDKDWSLTDCISFVVMKQRGIAGALTGDRHFEQAGFESFLK